MRLRQRPFNVGAVRSFGPKVLNRAWLLFLLALAVRLWAWPFTDVVDPDASTRALLAQRYMSHPEWLGDGVWPPLHFYLMGPFIRLLGDRVIGSVLPSVLLGSAVVLPVYSFAKRLAGERVAAGVAMLIAFDPLVLHNSFQGMAEVPGLFFSLCAMDQVLAAQIAPTGKGGWHAGRAGLWATIASGMRYEGWLLIPILSMLLVVARKWRPACVFTAVALVFPLAWMVTNLIAHGNALYGIDYAHFWNTQVSGVRQEVDHTQWLTRTIFFPLSLVMVLSPVIVLGALAGLLRFLVHRRPTAIQVSWIAPFLLFLAVDIYKAQRAELLLQHRFTTSLLMTFMPLLALGLHWIKKEKVVWLVALVAATGNILWSIHGEIPGSWVREGGTGLGGALVPIRDQAHGQICAFPRLENDGPDRLVAAIRPRLGADQALVVDFFGWQQTYNVALRGRARQVFFLSPEELDQPPNWNDLLHFLQENRGRRTLLVLDPRTKYGASLGNAIKGEMKAPFKWGPCTLRMQASVEGLGLFALERLDDQGEWEWPQEERRLLSLRNKPTDTP